MLQKTHFKLPSGDWKWLVRKGNVIVSLAQISLRFHVNLLYLILTADQISEQSFYCWSVSPGLMLLSIDLCQVILAEVLCDCSSSQAVVKELRVSASPLEQRKFLAESEPYR